MSRFIKYASNLLDGVDSMAKGSLTDQDLAAAAAERRRRRKQERLRQQRLQQGGEDGELRSDHYQSDFMSEDDSAQQLYGYPSSEGGRAGDGGIVTIPHASAAAAKVEAGAGTTVGGSRMHDNSYSSHAAADGDDEVRAADERGYGQGASRDAEAGAAYSVAEGRSSFPGASSGALFGDGDGDGDGDGGDAGADAGDAFTESTREIEPSAVGVSGRSSSPRTTATTVDTVLTPSPTAAGLASAPQAQEAGPSIPLETQQDVVARASDSVGQDGDFGDGGSGGSGNGGTEVEGNAEPSPERERQVSATAANSRAKSGSTNPTVTEQGSGSGGGGSERHRGGFDVVGSTTFLGGDAEKGRPGQQRPEGRKPSLGAMASAENTAAAGHDEKRVSADTLNDEAGQRSGGLGRLLRRGAKTAWGAGGGGDMEALKAEADALRAEVEELSLELEDAEDRLRGQETELYKAAEMLKRHKASAQEREAALAQEMAEFRGLQEEQKKVFLSNLEGMEKTLKDKEREMSEGRDALTALETFAMEREDTATRLQHEKEELLEELKIARSGQDRSAEEMREALARAETEAEEAGARHRTWMRQAQARQTELEATAAQLAEALAEAERKAHPGATEGSVGQGQAPEAVRKALASARELRATQEELDSCQASLELEQERTRSLQQEVNALRNDLDGARAMEAVVERQRQEHASMAADSLAKASRLEQQLQQERAKAQRLGAPLPAGPESQIQSLSSKLLDKQARLEESVCERATLSAKLREATARASRAEQELREARGESLEAGEGTGGRVRRRAESRGVLGRGGRASTGAWSKLRPIAKHKKIASAVDVVDRVTLQAVVFVRNSPAARAVFLAYLLLLHVWAFAILSLHSHKSTLETSKPNVGGVAG